MGGGGYSGSNELNATTGPFAIGGLTIAPSNNQTVILAAALVAVAFVGFALLKKA